MLYKKASLILFAAVTGMTLVPGNIHAITTSSSHTTTSSTHTTTTTAARSTTMSPSRTTTSPTSRTGLNSSTTRVASPASKNMVSNKSISSQRAITNASKSSTYRSLTTPAERTSYLNWHENYTNNSYRYFTSIQYFYMPFNIWHSTLMGNNQDKLATNMTIVAKQRNYRWIKVGSKMIAVPEKIYNMVKVGDRVTLLDNNHIQINGKTISN